jgi:hypothetical protein
LLCGCRGLKHSVPAKLRGWEPIRSLFLFSFFVCAWGRNIFTAIATTCPIESWCAILTMLVLPQRFETSELFFSSFLLGLCSWHVGFSALLFLCGRAKARHEQAESMYQDCGTWHVITPPPQSEGVERRFVLFSFYSLCADFVPGGMCMFPV